MTKNPGMKKDFKAPSAEAELQALMPLVEMQETKAFQVWLLLIKGELKKIEKWSWRVGGTPPRMNKESNEVAKLLDELGCQWPQNETEMFKLWGNFRAVVNYFNSKIAFLEKQRERVKQLKESIRTEEARRRERGEK